jgi:hypothetical protein
VSGWAGLAREIAYRPTHRRKVSEEVLDCLHQTLLEIETHWSWRRGECVTCLVDLTRPREIEVKVFWLVGPFAQLAGREPGQWVEILHDGERLALALIRSQAEPPLRSVE